MNGRKKAPFLWVIPLFLSLFSVIVIVSSTSEEAIATAGHPYAIGIKQLVWLGGGLLCMAICYVFPLDFCVKHSGLLWFLSLCLVLLPFVPGIGKSAGGAMRWIRLGPLSVQPSEILSIFMVIHVAKKLFLGKESETKTFFVVFAILLITLLPVLLQPDMGTSILLFGVGMGMVIQAQGWFFPLLSSSIFFIMGAPLVLFRSYRLRRIKALLDPWKDPLDLGFQTIQGLIAFANGGVSGVGIGRGMQKLNYLPATHTDYILSSVGEEYGLIGTGTIMMLYMGFILFLQKLFYQCSDALYQTLFWGITLSLLLPAIINFGGVLNLLPLTGMPCPFLSYGGSSMITSWAKIGFLLNISYRVPQENTDTYGV